MKRSYQGEMGKSMVAILLLGALLASCIGLNLKVEARASSLSEIEIEAKLKLLNKPAVKTIKSEDGDIIDCVDIYKQPAFDHPALKNHKIQMAPDFLLESQSSENASNTKSVVFQSWQRSGSCPKGTIPIRRIQKKDLLRFASLERFGRKPPEPFNNSPNTTNGHYLHFPNLNITTNDLRTKVILNRSAAYLVTMGYNYIGSQANINVWNPNPNVDLPDDFTTAQIWNKAGNGPDYFESVEAGWMVNPKLYGDKATRLFAYWTRDSYYSTGCFDLTCSGFVHTSPDIVLGGIILPVSTEFSEQYKIDIGTFLDPKSGNWYLRMGVKEVGYWPAEILGNLRHSAILVEWGGQVFSSAVKTEPPHTGTGMGSGDFASALMGHACFMDTIRIKDYSLAYKYPEFVSAVAEEPYCYSAKNYQQSLAMEPIFFFGGPGRSPPYCP